MGEIESGFKWWMRYVVVPIIGGGGIIAIIVAFVVSGGSSKHNPSPLSKTVQEGEVKLSPQTADACFDNMNKTSRTCSWLALNIVPKVPNSNLKVSVTLDADFTIAPGPYTDTNGCTGDAGTTDKWRAGGIILRCGDGDDATGGPWQMEGPGHEVEVRHFFKAYAICEATHPVTHISLLASPRGCSSMKIIDGVLNYKEISN